MSFIDYFCILQMWGHICEWEESFKYVFEMYLEVCWSGWCCSCKRGWDCQELMSGALLIKYLRKAKQLTFKFRFYLPFELFSKNWVHGKHDIQFTGFVGACIVVVLHSVALVGLSHPHSWTGYRMTSYVYLTFPVQGQKYKDDSPKVTLQA